MNTKNLNQTSSDYTCEFCDRKFAREQTLLAHTCKQKLREQDRKSPDGALALTVYDKFYQQTQRKTKTWDQFSTSPYYNGFMKFAKYIRSMDVVNPLLYVDWVIKNNVKLDAWAKDSTYERYLTQLLANESVDSGITRTLSYMQEWADQHGLTFEQYMYHTSPNKLVRDIASGRITPWILYGTTAGQSLLAKLNEEQVHLIIKYIDPDVWTKKIQTQQDDLTFVRDVLAQAGIQ
jgi:hypothetical protein